jgi:TetR/AcrR family transcriptional regulator, regulator of cefoperazone and chloramphenicol sensitivity
MGSPETPARVTIRDEALRLFAEHGADAVSLRQVATAAGVSPGLVVHHFGGKEGLRAAVDEHAAGICEDVLREVRRSAHDGDERLGPFADGDGGASLAETLLRRLPHDSPVPLYLRRLLLAGDQAGLRVFRAWYHARRELLENMVAAGLARPGRDRTVRSAFLVVNDLAVLLLRDQLVQALGLDPLTHDGMTRWARQARTVYRDGFLAEDTE